jgi:hypothetical protein
MLPWQQPLQFCGPQEPEPASGGGGVAQAPPWHVAGVVQATHGLPCRPHFKFVPVVMHCVPSQQPLQVSGPQLDEVQVLARQLCVWLQAEHAPPSTPQAKGELPGWHTPPSSTQPLQLDATWQRLLWHDWPVAQGAQAAPAMPQYWLVLPPRQKSLVSQQPLQFDAPHPPSRGPAVPPSPATHAPF